MIGTVQSEHRLSLTRTCDLMSISKTAYYYKPKKRQGDEAIIEYLQALAAVHKRWGFEMMKAKAKIDGKPWNHKRIRRIYCELGLNIRVKPRKRIPKGEAKMLMQPIRKNICWSMDFMSDAMMDGRKFRTFNVIDDYNREALMVQPSFSLPAIKVTQLLEQIALRRGYPEMIRVDNGTEFRSDAFAAWAKKNHILLNFTQPGKPAQNGFIERFNRTYREDILDMNLFSSLQEVDFITRAWLNMYNKERPHQALAGKTPFGFAQQRLQRVNNKTKNSTSKQY